jgi:LPXTG-site transpeptidase (sortase) family protein
MFKKKTRVKFYKKAPVKFLLKQARSLKRWAFFSFTLSIILLVLSNPFIFYEQLKSLPTRVQEIRQVASSIPEFIKVFPKEAEKNSFAFFDWTKAQLDNVNHWPIFAKEPSLADKEAGQSAVANKDYAKLAFFIEIPKLNLYEKVQANVDPNNSKEYQTALKEGVAHALNSAFPGENKLIYIFGHSTNGAWNVEAYNAVFYQIKDLEIGDEVILHLGEQKFIYQVSEQNVVKGNEINFVNDRQNEDILLLQTCWPPGTSWQRLFVSAVPVIL